MSLQWNDPRYGWEPSDYDDITSIPLPFSTTWAPEVILHNAVEEKFIFRWTNHDFNKSKINSIKTTFQTSWHSQTHGWLCISDFDSYQECLCSKLHRISIRNTDMPPEVWILGERTIQSWIQVIFNVHQLNRIKLQIGFCINADLNMNFNTFWYFQSIK